MFSILGFNLSCLPLSKETGSCFGTKVVLALGFHFGQEERVGVSWGVFASLAESTLDVERFYAVLGLVWMKVPGNIFRLSYCTPIQESLGLGECEGS